MRSIRRFFTEFAEDMRIAFDALVSHRLRTFLTTLGIVIGVTTVIAIVAIIQGLNRSFSEQISQVGANTLYIQRWPWVSLDDNWWIYRNRKRLTKREYEAILRESKIAVAVSPSFWNLSTVGAEGWDLPDIFVLGTSSAQLDTSGGTLLAGRFLADADVELSRKVVVIGADVTDQLFHGYSPESVVGQRLRIGGRHFTIIGLLARRGQILGSSMDNRIMIPYTSFKEIYGGLRDMNLAVAAPNGKISELEDELTGILRRVRQVPPEKPDDFAINRQDQLLKVYEQLTGALYGVAVGVGLITLIVGGIGIMNIMIVSVHERTREIGVRRALGARRRTILTQFLIESSAVASLGGGIGTALGLGAAQAIAILTPLAAAVTPSAIALGLGFSAAVGLLFGSWPAWRAANLDPVEALRYE
jgi:putative ABC transport system permease protein